MIPRGKQPRTVAEAMRIVAFTTHNYGHAAALAAILARHDSAKKKERA